MELLKEFPEIPWFAEEYSTAPHPKIEFPTGARIAVVIHTALEAWSELSNAAITHYRAAQTEEDPLAASQAGEYDFDSVSMHDYGGRCGIHRILDLYEKHDIRGTFAINGLAAVRYPEALRRIGAGGHELAAHAWAQDIRHAIMTPDLQRRDIEMTAEAIEKAGGRRPVGWISPGGGSSASTLRYLVDRGFEWIGDPKNDDDPYILRPEGGGRIVAVGSRGGRTGINDIEILRGGQPRALLQRFIDEFDYMYEESASRPRIVFAVMHAEVQSASVTRVYDEMIKYVKGFPGVWFTSRGELARLVLDQND